MIKVDKEIICVCVCIPSQTWNKDEKKYENNEEKIYMINTWKYKAASIWQICWLG